VDEGGKVRAVVDGEEVGTGVDGGTDGTDDPPTMSVSRHETKISSVHLQIHSQRSVTGPDGMSAGKLTSCGKVLPLFQ